MEYYNGKTVLLTGSTGFVGKIVLEKLLFALPLVHRVYLILRPKKGFSLTERFHRELMASICFDRLRSVHGLRYEQFVSQKVVPLQGDLNLPGLGLSPADRATLIREVDCVLSVAASVEFNARIDEAIKTNILGVLQLLKLAQESTRLSSFTHMSTCYVNCNRPQGLIEEIVYPGILDPEEELAGLLSLPLQELIKQTTNITRGFPNTYTYTKNLCERLLLGRRGGLSLTIVRPSIISSAVREPAVGWVDSVVAIGAVYLYAGLGILRHLHCQEDKVGDLIPVDIVADYTIVANACHAGKGQFNLHHCGSSQRNPCTWGIVLHGSTNYYTLNPPQQRVAMIDLALIGNPVVAALKMGARRAGLQVSQKLASLVGSQKMRKDIARFKKFVAKAQLINQVFQFFMNNEWVFEQQHISELEAFLGDEQRFNVDSCSYDVPHWVCVCSYGIHKFILKEKVGQPPAIDTYHANPNAYFDDIQWALSHPATFGTTNQPDYRTRIIHSDAIKAAIQEHVETLAKKGQRPERSEREGHKLAQQWVQRVVCRPRTGRLRVFAWSLHKMFRQLFERIEVNKQQISAVGALQGPVILLPNHRSYMDYVLLSYIFFSYGLKLPYVTSDGTIDHIFLLSHLLRASGVFEFSLPLYRTNRIYKAVSDQYLKELMSDGATLLSFLEGTRSRTGKTLQPNFELLQAAIQGFEEGRFPDVTLVPVAINYERVVEGDTFPLELMGEQKVKESFIRLVKSARLLKQNYGQIYVEFCQPIKLSQFLKKVERQQASRLGLEVLHRINERNVILPVSLVSAIMLQFRKGISEQQLGRKVQWLYRLVLERGHRVGGVNEISPSVTVRAVIAHLNNVVVKSRHNVFELSLTPGREYENVLLLSYYRNTLMHVFANESLLLLGLNSFGQALSRQDGVPITELMTELNFGLELLKREVVVRDRLSSDNLAQVVQTMKERGILQRGGRGESLRVSRLGEEAAQFMCSLVWPIVESYWATVSYLSTLSQQTTELKVRSFIQQVQWYAECMHDDRVMEYYESCSVQTISNAFHALVEAKLLTVRKDTILSISSNAQVSLFEQRVRRYLRNAHEKVSQIAKL